MPQSDHYSYDSNRRGRKERSLRKLNVLDVIVLLVTVVFCILLLFAYTAPVVNPNSGWFVSVLGLVAPILYLTNIALTLYWMVRWKGYILLPVIALVAGAGSVARYYKPEVRKHYGDEGKPSLTVMSYNVEGFLNHDELNNPRLSMDSIGAFIAGQNPGILCMQEYQTTARLSGSRLTELLPQLPFTSIYYVIAGREPDTGLGLAVYSAYPILAEQAIQFPDTYNCALRVDVAVGKDTVRLFNCHLQTTSLSWSDKQFMTAGEFVQSDTQVKKTKVKRILGKLRDNYRIRAMQADSIAQLVAESPYPVIVCGDFNDTPMSYAYHRVRGGLSDAFEQKGRGSSHTYRGFMNLFRIDYILYDPRYKAVSYASPESDISDHNPVVVGLKRVE